MAMIEFEDHSEENQRALLAYLAGEKPKGWATVRPLMGAGILHRLARLFARLSE
jgi:hypothetical protein